MWLGGLCGTTVSHAQTKVTVPESNATLGDVDGYSKDQLKGWTLFTSEQLVRDSRQETLRAIELLGEQLETVEKRLPAEVVQRLRQVPLWFSPKYQGFSPRAEYHPNAQWLKDNGRLPAMAKGIEFTNVEIFQRECLRMPMLAFHELAHAYHDQVLGFAMPDIRRAFETAQENGSYAAVQRWRGPNIAMTVEKSYAMSNHKEYFAEGSEAYFGRNDYFPFEREELKRHDPRLFELLGRLWKVEP